jgi:AcrR family transcriptional regulator
VVAEGRRPRAATAAKRDHLLDVAERIMLADGYAAVTSRRVEAEAGRKLHYHFGTIDDLFIALVRRRGEDNIARIAEALGSAEPLRAWWRLAADRRGNALLVELTAAANHRPALQAELAAFAQASRRMEIEALRSMLAGYGIDAATFPPELVAAAVHGLGFAMAHDQVAGFDTAQDEATVAMTRLVDELEARRSAGVGTTAPTSGVRPGGRGGRRGRATRG